MCYERSLKSRRHGDSYKGRLLSNKDWLLCYKGRLLGKKLFTVDGMWWYVNSPICLLKCTLGIDDNIAHL